MPADGRTEDLRDILDRLARRLARIEAHLGLDADADVAETDPARGEPAIHRRDRASLRDALARLASPEVAADRADAKADADDEPVVEPAEAPGTEPIVEPQAAEHDVALPPVEVDADVDIESEAAAPDAADWPDVAPPPPPPPPSWDPRRAASPARPHHDTITTPDDPAAIPDDGMLAASVAASPPAPASLSASPSPERPRRTSMEELIGGNWAAWGGAGILFLATVFAIKIAVDRGWWGALAPSAKCAAIAVGGLAMIVAGEVAFRRIGRRASVGLFGAGLGILYLDAFAAFQFWDLVPGGGAFLLMGIVAIGGFALTYRTGSLTIGVLSIVGGFLTPMLLRGQSGRDVELLSYLTMLLGISLGLAATNRRAFWPMRFLALIATGLVMFFWLVGTAGNRWIIGLIFMAIWWTMVLAESLVAALRGHSRMSNVVMTLAATAAWATAGTWLLSGTGAVGSDWTGVFTLCIAALASAAALQFGPGLDGLRARVRTPMDVLAMALWIQAAILLTTAVALHFDESGRAVAWLVIAVGAIETGRRLPSRGLDIFGLLVGALALFDVAAISWIFDPRLRDELTVIGPITVTGWSIISLVAIAASVAGAIRLRDRWPTNWRIAPVVLTVIAVVQWLMWWQVVATTEAVTFGWLAGAAILLAVSPWGRRQRTLGIAGLVIVAATVRWVVIDLIGERVDPGWDPGAATPLLNGPTITAVVIGLLGWWMVRQLAGRRRQLVAEAEMSGILTDLEAVRADRIASRGLAITAQLAALGIVLVGLLALSFDADRIVEGLFVADPNADWLVGHVRQNVLTALWAVGALALAVLGRIAAITGRPSDDDLAPPAILDVAATFILVGCAIKFLLVDTLGWVINSGREVADGLMPVVNVQMFTGVVIAVAGLLVRRWLRRTRPANAPGALDRPEDAEADGWIPVGAAIVLLWALTFEIDRVLGPGATEASAVTSIIDPWLLRGLWWAGLWTAGGVVLAGLGRWRRSWLCVPAGAAMVAGSAIAWLGYATLGWRLGHPPLDVPVIGNLQFCIGVLVAAGAIGLAVIHRGIDASIARRLFREINVPGTVVGTVVLIGLWLGTVELDRALVDDPKLRLASFSVWWGLYAIGLIAAGFARRSALARFTGLGLLALTAIKVVAIDMAGIDNIWRVVSSAAIGLLLLATSVVYARFGASVKDEEDDARDDDGFAAPSGDDGPGARHPHGEDRFDSTDRPTD